MANVSKIIGSLATAINKVSGSAISGLSKIMGATISLFSNTKSLSHGITSEVDFATAASTASDFQLTEADAWSISFWIKPGWTSSLGTSTHLIASSEAGSSSAQDEMWRVYYNESNNRLYFGWRSASNQRSNNFIYFHNPGVNAAATISGLGNSFPSDNWTAAHPGYTNANGFTLITLTKGTGTFATNSNWTAYWNSKDLGNPWYSSGNNNGTPDLTDSVARKFSIGNKSWDNKNNMNGAATLYDEVSLWNVELSQAQVAAIWNGTDAVGAEDGVPLNLQDPPSPLNSDNLIGYWRFETDGTVSTVGSATLTLGGDVESVTSPA